MKRLVIAPVLLLTLTAGMCQHGGGYPPKADLVAVTEAKPVPTEAILTDPVASDRHNAAIESWGDRVSAAGARLCRFFEETGMDVNCPG